MTKIFIKISYLFKESIKSIYWTFFLHLSVTFNNKLIFQQLIVNQNKNISIKTEHI